jgi:hypothetical protein
VYWVCGGVERKFVCWKVESGMVSDESEEERGYKCTSKKQEHGRSE